ncbi:MAG: hypothetical protein PHP59_05380 [Methanofollis sp.]|uniref:hypothetical protein n=1 Tax=Methanofollis sp. TaxID=2052835 RepID=UPI00260718FD|nr:hypothetical protein [Methanofollis sp.]MDD4254792.1 hypothetical protein [Methanofollis sp.]
MEDKVHSYDLWEISHEEGGGCRSGFFTIFDRFRQVSPPVEKRVGSVVTADQKLRRDLMIIICTYVPLFTRWKEHRVQATARVMGVWVSVILRLVKTIFKIGGEMTKLKCAIRMRPESFSTPVERCRKGGERGASDQRGHEEGDDFGTGFHRRHISVVRRPVPPGSFKVLSATLISPF